MSLSPLSLATDVTDAILGASGIWLGTATLTKSFFIFFFVAAHESMDNRLLKCSFIFEALGLNIKSFSRLSKRCGDFLNTRHNISMFVFFKKNSHTALNRQLEVLGVLIQEL